MLKKKPFTKSVKASEIKRKVVFFDAQGEILGRLSTQIAIVLQGKDKTNYVPYLDGGDYAVVINAKLFKVTGRKMKQKEYTRYSGYQSGLKKVSLQELKEQRPEEVIKRAVKGMLPDNKLKKDRVKRLFIFKEQEYQLPKEIKKLPQEHYAQN